MSVWKQWPRKLAHEMGQGRGVALMVTRQGAVVYSAGSREPLSMRELGQWLEQAWARVRLGWGWGEMGSGEPRVS